MLTLLAMLMLGQSPCVVGGKGPQCVTAERTAHGTFECRGLCFTKPGQGDGGYDFCYLGPVEANEKAVCINKIEKLAATRCP